MATKDKRIDAYIAKSQPFAQPVMKKMRELVHKACPEVTETIKWGMPSFEYKGPMFGFAAFKAHCVGGFWKSKLLKDPNNLLGEGKNQGGEAMGNLGCMTSVKDLPPDKAMIDFIKQHMKLNDEGIKVERKLKPKKELVIPKELTAALGKDKKAKETFEKFPPSQKREYAEWIIDAKTDETRNRRLKDAVQWMSEGKPRMWKYMKK
ncbi:MAG TPA: YdeI/OmpD-associated family protein [Bacteroidia bacterium]|nr:YdeI/OmpD-associated family protein [Bacteroidia bacterium]